MRPEPVEDKIKSPEKAGVLGFRATIVKAEDGVELKKILPWKKRLAKRPTSLNIRAFIFQCRDLPAADEDGMADPFVVPFTSIEKAKDKKN